MKIGLLISGGLGLTVFKMLITEYKINFVLCDRMSESIIDFSKKNNIPYYAGNPRNGKAISVLGHLECDIIVSVNYLFIVEKDIINLPKKFAVNFHGSLLPKYRGRTPHVWAIINNEKHTGITSHIIDENCDTGDIISQLNVTIEPYETGADILLKFNELYPKFVLDTLKSIESNSFSLKKQNNEIASYFGKRTKEDGQINWSWQKERIYNWVRAQSKPYPGAFSYLNNYKIIIHKVTYSDFGFNYDIENGTILSLENSLPIIKTPNGCLQITDFEFEEEINISDILK